LFPLVRTPGGRPLQAGLAQSPNEQAKRIKNEQHWLGRSEILVSLLGKHKRIQGTHSKKRHDRIISEHSSRGLAKNSRHDPHSTGASPRSRCEKVDLRKPQPDDPPPSKLSLSDGTNTVRKRDL
jgi:hypothetical protein